MELENGNEPNMHSLNKHLLNAYYAWPCEWSLGYNSKQNRPNSCPSGDFGSVKSVLWFALHINPFDPYNIYKGGHYYAHFTVKEMEA